MPLALVLLALLGLVAVVALQAPGSSSSSGSVDAAPLAPASDAILGAPLLPGASDASAGAGLFQSLGETLSKIWSPPPAAAPYLGAISAAEQHYGLPSGLLARQLAQESAYKPDVISGQTTSSAGAIGIAQLEPATAADLGVDPTDPYASIDAAARYMRTLYDKTGSWFSALAAYDWGIGNVLKHGMAAAPAETQAYVSKISADVPGLS